MPAANPRKALDPASTTPTDETPGERFVICIVPEPETDKTIPVSQSFFKAAASLARILNDKSPSRIFPALVVYPVFKKAIFPWNDPRPPDFLVPAGGCNSFFHAKVAGVFNKPALASQAYMEILLSHLVGRAFEFVTKDIRQAALPHGGNQNEIRVYIDRNDKGWLEAAKAVTECVEAFEQHSKEKLPIETWAQTSADPYMVLWRGATQKTPSLGLDAVSSRLEGVENMKFRGILAVGRLDAEGRIIRLG